MPWSNDPVPGESVWQQRGRAKKVTPFEHVQGLGRKIMPILFNPETGSFEPALPGFRPDGIDGARHTHEPVGICVSEPLQANPGKEGRE